MASLSTHLTAAVTAGGAHGRLAFRDDCPICHQERLAGPPLARPLVPKRAQASLAAALLALSSVTPAATAIAATAPAGEQGTTDPQAPQPGGEETPNFDPGAEQPDQPLEPEGPPPAPVPHGGEDDDSEGAPVETEPEDGPAAEASPPAQAPPVPVTPPALEAPPAPGPPLATPPPPSTPAPAPPLEKRDATPGAQAKQRPAARPPKRAHRPQGPRAPGSRSAPVADTPSTPGGAPSAATSPSAGDPMPTAQPETAAAGRRDSGRPASGRVRTVRPGESLWSIASELAGPRPTNAEIARLVNRLWQLNDDQIATGDPDLLPIGTRLVLP